MQKLNHVNSVVVASVLVGSVDRFNISMSVQYIDLLFVKLTGLCFAFLLSISSLGGFYT